MQFSTLVPQRRTLFTGLALLALLLAPGLVPAQDACSTDCAPWILESGTGNCSPGQWQWK